MDLASGHDNGPVVPATTEDEMESESNNADGEISQATELVEVRNSINSGYN